MTYNKPELDVKKFDIIEEITDGGNSAASPSQPPVDTRSKSAADSIGSDLIIG